MLFTHHCERSLASNTREPFGSGQGAACHVFGPVNSGGATDGQNTYSCKTGRIKQKWLKHDKLLTAGHLERN